MIVVELAGPSGGGKSTLISLVAQRLRSLLGKDAVADLPEKGVPRRQRRWTRVKRWSWVAVNPQLYWSAWKITRPPIRTTGVAEWVRSFSTMGLARRAVEQGVEVALVDQGLLRMPMLPEHVPHLDRSLFPDFVIHIYADAALLEQRRLKRKKKKCLRYGGEKRASHAATALFNIRHTLDEAARHEWLLKFAEKFCDQPFSETEMQMLLAKARELDAMPPEEAEAFLEENRSVQRCSSGVCESLQKLGIPVIKVDTTEIDVEEAVENCVDAVMEELEKRGVTVREWRRELVV